MSTFPKVFIVILNFNAFNDTSECLESLECIDYENYEIIVVDNASLDDSYDTLKLKFPKYKFIKAQENLGYACGNNLGIKYALENKADYVCILNNDVVVEKDFLTKIITVMETDKSIGAAGPCICEYKERDTIQAMGANINLFTGLTQGKHKSIKYKDINKENIIVDYLGGACFVCRREVFEKIGVIPENYFLFFEETEFCLKAKRSGFKLLCLYDSIVYHKGSSTINKIKGLSYFFLNRNRVIFIRRNANIFQKLVFSIYIFIEAIGRMIIRKEPFLLIKNILAGFRDDKYNIDIAKIKKYV